MICFPIKRLLSLCHNKKIINFELHIQLPCGKTKKEWFFNIINNLMSLKHNHIRKEDYIVFDHLIITTFKRFSDYM